MILFIAPNFSSFVRNDFEILSKKYKVQKFIYSARKKLWEHIGNQLRLFFWLLVKLPASKIVFIWFADYHSFLPVFLARIFRKNSYLVLGGYDVTYIPELDYGSFKNPLRAFCARYAMNHVSCNLPVADTLAEEIKQKAKKAKIRTVYTGHSGNTFFPDGKEKESFVLTVGTGSTAQRMKIKGIDFFLEVAQKMPQTKFVIVGMAEKVKQIYGTVPNNIHFTGWVEQRELLNYYRRAKVYAQFSLREGLPSSVCEAMLCECVPVGAKAGGIPIAIGECGFIVNNRNVDKAVALIQKAMTDDGTLGRCARRRVLDLFSVERREKELFKIFNEN